MAISTLPSRPSRTSAARPSSWRTRRHPPHGRSREPGLVALALGVLALASSVHPLWSVPAIAVAVVAGAAAARALPCRGERRPAAAGLVCAALALLVCSVTAPAAVGAGLALLGWLAALRPGP
ncbi:hypothetical protein ACVLV4_001369 [Rathayibacter agropyri]